MGSQVLWSLHSRFLPAQTQKASGPQCDSVASKLAQALGKTIPTVHGVTMKILNYIPTALTSKTVLAVRFKPGLTNASFDRIAANAVDELLKAPTASPAAEVIKWATLYGGGIWRLKYYISNSAKRCFLKKCGVQEWLTEVLFPEWSLVEFPIL